MWVSDVLNEAHGSCIEMPEPGMFVSIRAAEQEIQFFVLPAHREERRGSETRPCFL